MDYHILDVNIRNVKGKYIYNLMCRNCERHVQYISDGEFRVIHFGDIEFSHIIGSKQYVEELSIDNIPTMILLEGNPFVWDISNE